MSEFSVIKCKACDASLTVMEGEILSKCVQCNYKFKIGSPGSNMSSESEKFFERAKVLAKTKKVKQSAHQRKKTRTNSQAVEQKMPSSSWANVIKWYIIFSIAIGILSNIFKS